jgi:hypothetical protein
LIEKERFMNVGTNQKQAVIAIANKPWWRRKVVVWYARAWGVGGTLFGVYTAIMFGVNLWKAGGFFKDVVEARPVIYAAGGGQVGAKKINCNWRSIDKPTAELKGTAQLTLKPEEFTTFDAGSCKHPSYYIFSSYGVFTLLGIRPDNSEVEVKLFDILEEHDDIAFDPATNKFAVKFKNSIAFYNLRTGFIGFHKIDFPGCFGTTQGNYSGMQWLPSGELNISFSNNSCEKANVGSGSIPITLRPVDRTIFKKIKPRTVRVQVKIDDRSSITQVNPVF